MAKKFVTKSLDVAAFLYAKGIDCEITKHGLNRCSYIYEDKSAERLAKQFMRCEVMMNVAKYIYARTELKNRIKMMPFVTDTMSSNLLKIGTGAPYWYTENGVVFNATFGECEPHITRLKEGRVFKTKEEAKTHLNI